MTTIIQQKSAMVCLYPESELRSLFGTAVVIQELGRKASPRQRLTENAPKWKEHHATAEKPPLKRPLKLIMAVS